VERSGCGAARAEQLGRAAGGKVTVALAQFGRVLSALGDSRHEDAYVSVQRLKAALSDPNNLL